MCSGRQNGSVHCEKHASDVLISFAEHASTTHVMERMYYWMLARCMPRMQVVCVPSYTPGTPVTQNTCRTCLQDLTTAADNCYPSQKPGNATTCCCRVAGHRERAVHSSTTWAASMPCRTAAGRLPLLLAARCPLAETHMSTATGMGSYGSRMLGHLQRLYCTTWQSGRDSNNILSMAPQHPPQLHPGSEWSRQPASQPGRQGDRNTQPSPPVACLHGDLGGRCSHSSLPRCVQLAAT
jgi:hypothetical protein